MNRWLLSMATDDDRVPDSGGPDGDLTAANNLKVTYSPGRLFEGAVSRVHILAAGVKSNTSVLNFCKASPSGGGMVWMICCFTEKSTE